MKLDSEGKEAPYKKGDRVYVCPLKLEASVVEQILHHDGPETFWGNLKLQYDDGSFGISNSWQCQSVRPHKELYKLSLNRVHTLAGHGDAGWNDRFKVALDAQGMCLSSTLPAPSDKYPDNIPYNAPRPYEPKDAWPADTYICWKEDIHA